MGKEKKRFKKYKKTGVTKHEREMAHFSNAAYQGTHGGHSGRRAAQKYVDKHIGKGWVEDENNSTRDYRTYVNEKEKRVVVSHKGTDPSKMRDLRDDVFIGLGQEKYNPRFKNAQTNLEHVVKQYKDFDVNSTGHSLGGAMAAFAAENSKSVLTTAFNRGSTTWFKGNKNNHLKDMYNPYDPISNSVATHRNTTKKSMAHSTKTAGMLHHNLDQWF